MPEASVIWDANQFKLEMWTLCLIKIEEVHLMNLSIKKENKVNSFKKENFLNKTCQLILETCQFILDQ